MEMMLFGFALILIIFTWSYVWQPTVLDSARDKLFDLRDNVVREYFVRSGLGLEHPIYVALRNLINGHLRHTESLTLFHFGYMVFWAEVHREEDELVRGRINTMFATDDPELAKLVKNVRDQSSMIMVDYMVESSVVALVTAIIGLVWFVVRSVAVGIYKFVFGHGPASGITLARLALALLALTSSLGVMSRTSAQATMEECALHKPA